jgi:hypothetical protein
LTEIQEPIVSFDLDEQQRKILHKAQAVLNLQDYEHTCLKARICPKCGLKLIKVPYDTMKGWAGYYLCSCGFYNNKYNGEI